MQTGLSSLGVDKDGRAEAILRALGAGGGVGTIPSFAQWFDNQSESGALPKHRPLHQQNSHDNCRLMELWAGEMTAPQLSERSTIMRLDLSVLVTS